MATHFLIWLSILTLMLSIYLNILFRKISRRYEEIALTVIEKIELVNKLNYSLGSDAAYNKKVIARNLNALKQNIKIEYDL